MSSCWLIDILPSDSEVEELRQLGMSPVETISWHHVCRNVPGLINLLREAGAVVDTPQEPHIVVLAPVEIRQSNGRKFEDVHEYFYELTRQSLHRLGVQSSLDVDVPDVLAFNLMPFYPRAAIADRVMNGICRAIEAVPHLSSTCLAFFVRTHRPFSGNADLRRLVQSSLYPNKAIIVDLDGFLINLERDYVKGRNKLRVTRYSIARSIFERVLHFKDKRSFRRALVYQTNINIGHFDLGTCHVRTHYDLNDFVRRDNVFEHIYSEFCHVTAGFNNIAVIATGLERNALTVLGNRLQSANVRDLQMTSRGSLQSRDVTWRGHFFADEVSSHAEQIKGWVRGSDCVLVLTDIVNSGSTARRTGEAFRRILKDMETRGKTHNGKIEIKTFAVAKMNNSPSDIEASVVINRPYFSSDQALCPLCQLKQPIKKVEQDTWEEDFRYVDPAQLTPLDFWEMVKDCDALQREKSYAGGIRLMHRVDTERLLQRYSHWLANVIAAKYRSTWGRSYPDMLLIVSEEGGLRFAALVGDALRPHRCRILSIPRAVLDEKQEPSCELTNELAKCRDLRFRVLLADDGMNFGNTARHLIRLARKYEVDLLGMLVLDCRLETSELQRFETEAVNKNFRIEALYTWPSHPVVAWERVSV